MKKTLLFVTTLLILSACSGTAATDNIGGDWSLVSYGDAANPTPAIAEVETSVVFEDNANGAVGGNLGCNSFGGNYEISGSEITFNSITSTLMFCEETSSQEQVVLAVFSDNVNLPFEINGNTLTITSADGSSVVHLERK